MRYKQMYCSLQIYGGISLQRGMAIYYEAVVLYK